MGMFSSNHSLCHHAKVHPVVFSDKFVIFGCHAIIAAEKGSFATQPAPLTGARMGFFSLCNNEKATVLGIGLAAPPPLPLQKKVSFATQSAPLTGARMGFFSLCNNENITHGYRIKSV
nr:uncharacterized protein LOC127331667 [Lolium perenne]XP_051213803.1 uncharacterized protein LOC127331668 isoform X1 [Lolium perenne]XP_051213804.1 uncharacterized protein LOC127331668 isoform X2 [Lolium perenne]XP_051213805.1 uncharacterized protein LOC127331668 isoform X3 [Lolium perenne]XP_051213807.1 uncharacterized protein LOC127331668 isoform X4 [Lolium perenne]XP_051213808.1 uncharacterized protein LOC127331668 isoform X5 [Lolium perenne]